MSDKLLCMLIRCTVAVTLQPFAHLLLRLTRSVWRLHASPGAPWFFPLQIEIRSCVMEKKTPFCWQEAVSTQYRLHQMPRSCARTLPFGNASRVAELRQVRGLGSSVQEVNRHDGERIVFGDLSPRKGRGTCSALTSPGPIAKLELLSHLEEVVDAGCDKLVLGSGQAESR